MLNGRATLFKQQSIVGLAVCVLGLLLAREMGGWIAEGNFTELELFSVAGAAAAIGVGILRNWRSGTYVFLVWLVFEDLIRKYLGNNMAIFFAKDVLAGLIYVSLYLAIRNRRDRWLRPPFLFALSFFFWFAFLQIFNPYSPNFLYGALGLKVYFFYVPLVFVGYALVRTERDLWRLLIVVMLLVAAVSGLGIIQAIAGPGFMSPATLAPEIRELGALEKVTPITHEVFNLPASVFVSAGRYSEFLFLSAVLGLGAACYSLLQRERWRWVVFASLGLVAVGVLLSGSRGTLILSMVSSAVMSLAFLWGAPWRTRDLYRMLKAIRRSAIIMGMCLSLAVLCFPKEIGSRWNFYSETLSPSSTAYEFTNRTWDYPIHNLMLAFSEPRWLTGNGTGTVSLGAQYVARLLHQRRPGWGVESGYGGILVELGIFGLILWLLWTTALVIGCWRVVRRLRQTPMFPIGFAVFWFALVLLFPQTFGSLNSYQDYAANAFLWLLVGILYRLPELIVTRPVALPHPAVNPEPNELASP
jgi:hypothetical protein